MRSITIFKLAKDLDLEVLAGHEGLSNRVSAEMVDRPGIELAGFLGHYMNERIHLIGTKESSFLSLFDDEVKYQRVEAILALNPPAIVFSLNAQVPDYFIELANTHKVPLLKSQTRTVPLYARIYSYLHSNLAPRQSVHGVLVDINGVGTLITGKSGIGKSETALELIKRGHILVSDDRVDIHEANPGVVIGSAPKILERFMEIRGIGIVDVVTMFGAGAFRENKKIRLVVEIEHWKKEKAYDRLGLSSETIRYFNTDIPKVTIPILPGRNTATLVESAAMNSKLKHMGHNAAEELTNAVAQMAARVQLGDEDID